MRTSSAHYHPLRPLRSSTSDNEHLDLSHALSFRVNRPGRSSELVAEEAGLIGFDISSVVQNIR